MPGITFVGNVFKQIFNVAHSSDRGKTTKKQGTCPLLMKINNMIYLNLHKWGIHWYKNQSSFFNCTGVGRCYLL